MQSNFNSTQTASHIAASNAHYEHIRQRLLELGVSSFAMGRMESRYLPKIIAPDEALGGVVYGKHPDGFAMLAATDKRIIFLDNKPFFVNEEEINYNVVSGVSMSTVGFISTVTLSTRMKDYALRTFNHKCANSFVRYIEQRSIQYQQNMSTFRS